MPDSPNISGTILFLILAGCVTYLICWANGKGSENMLAKILNYYNTNTKFHSFVQGLVGALIAAAASWNGGMPTTKQSLIVFAAFVAKALFSWWTRWAQKNVATVAVPLGASQISTSLQ